MSETLFPVRQRCKTCRGSLGKTVNDPVLRGLYCKPACAGMAALATRPADAPRECKTQRDNVWVWKRRYRSESEIPDKLREDPSTSWYWCGHCGSLHVGHTRMGVAEKLRFFVDVPADVADTLVKLRGHASINEVAKVAGVRPIRIKELENQVGHPDALKTLSKVLRVYHARLGVSLG